MVRCLLRMGASRQEVASYNFSAQEEARRVGFGVRRREEQEFCRTDELHCKEFRDNNIRFNVLRKLFSALRARGGDALFELRF
jgi:hypothetical protein